MKKKALLSPLYWGFGHAARLIAIRHQLVHEGYEIYWYLDGALLDFVFKDCPQDHFIENFEVQISYGKNALGTMFQILKQSGAFLKQIKADQQKTKQLQKQYQFDLIVSDNRYGIYHEDVKSILLTHQISIEAGFLSGIVQRTNLKWMLPFDEIRVPDFENINQSLAGKLSHPEMVIPGWLNKKLNYIGPLSRFSECQPSNSQSMLVLLSGPEPQRSILENILVEILENSSKKIVFVRGTQKNQPFIQPGIDFKQISETSQLRNLINNAEFVIARGGYSTLMDLYCARKKALLIPTPGQLEQEYLAKWNQGKHGFTFVHQNRQEILTALKAQLSL
jgi:uncharacterized protein (TIGR00661 family)